MHPSSHVRRAPLAPRRSWSRDEDARLRAAVDRHGPQRWALIAEAVGTRPEKSCRERWHNHLRPDTRKSGWTPEEDTIILAGVAELGTSWSCIANRLEGRTDHAIKNRYKCITRHTPAATTIRARPQPADSLAANIRCSDYNSGSCEAPGMPSGLAGHAPITAVPCLPSAAHGSAAAAAEGGRQPAALRPLPPPLPLPQQQQPQLPPRLDPPATAVASRSGPAAAAEASAQAQVRAEAPAQLMSEVQALHYVQTYTRALQERARALRLAPSSSSPTSPAQAQLPSSEANALGHVLPVDTTEASRAAHPAWQAAAVERLNARSQAEAAAELPAGAAGWPPPTQRPTSPHTRASITELARQLLLANAGTATESEAVEQALIEQMQHVLAPKLQRSSDTTTTTPRPAPEQELSLMMATAAASLGRSAGAPAVHAAREQRGSCRRGLTSMHTFGPGLAPWAGALEHAAPPLRSHDAWPLWQAHQGGTFDPHANSLAATLRMLSQQQQQPSPPPPPQQQPFAVPCAPPSPSCPSLPLSLLMSRAAGSAHAPIAPPDNSLMGDQGGRLCDSRKRTLDEANSVLPGPAY